MPIHGLSLTEAMDGWELQAKARQLSEHTIRDYQTTFRKLLEFLEDDPQLVDIGRKDIEEFLASRVGIKNKTLLNYHIGLSALWEWAVGESLVDENLLHSIRRPRYQKAPIVPYTRDEVELMLDAMEETKTYHRPGKRPTRHSLLNMERNRAMVLLLLDTGIRVEELCTLELESVDRKNQRIRVLGKGRKERLIPFSYRTGQVLWIYQRKERPDSYADNFFLTLSGDPLSTNAVLLMIRRLAKRAGVKKANVHRFRHTFAINYLRNGGDPWSLQMLLGHSTMDMVKTYLGLAQVDLDNAHKKASPVANWRL